MAIFGYLQAEIFLKKSIVCEYAEFQVKIKNTYI